ncbi:hypothetical protein ALC57_02177 [Trachymyrmex cornetzi]|uniref:Uncharacterized protein n=1 Tax=Trachymyrmex cornetzi TaxID=471704 RepID=A0A195EJM0_9HYME|nr:hypothetical protein ALC57_02177 [Trachymyrmex cornetzi]
MRKEAEPFVERKRKWDSKRPADLERVYHSHNRESAFSTFSPAGFHSEGCHFACGRRKRQSEISICV